MNMKMPFANMSMDEPNTLHEIGVEGTDGLIHISQFGVPNPSRFRVLLNFTSHGMIYGKTNGKQHHTIPGYMNMEWAILPPG